VAVLEPGRPRKFKNVNELETAINDYFLNITTTYQVFDTVIVGENEEGKVITEQKPSLNNAGREIYRTNYIEIPSIIGLCRHIGICKDTWNEYSNKKGFSDPIKRAKERIEQYLEEQLYRKEQVTGVIFNLKNNYGWKDKQEIESNNTNDNTVHIKLEGDLEEWAK
jgi:hypothetical protein